jgi:hypothetical protein
MAGLGNQLNRSNAVAPRLQRITDRGSQIDEISWRHRRTRATFRSVNDVDMDDVTRPLRDVHTGDCSRLLLWVGLNDRLQHASADLVGHHTSQFGADFRSVQGPNGPRSSNSMGSLEPVLQLDTRYGLSMNVFSLQFEALRTKVIDWWSRMLTMAGLDYR